MEINKLIFKLADLDIAANDSNCIVPVGCIIVDDTSSLIISHGYAKSLDSTQCLIDGCIKISVEGKGRNGKETCIRNVHAEIMACSRLPSNAKLKKLKCYCTYAPCIDCLKVLLLNGITNIMYKYEYTDTWRGRFLESYKGRCTLTRIEKE